MKAVIIGAPGSGKGTISKLLLKDFPKLKWLSSGDIFRYNIKRKTAMGIKAENFVSKGLLVSDQIVNQMMFSEIEKFSNDDFLIDGYPRTLNQAKELDKKIKNNGGLDCIIYLDVPHSIILDRIKDRWIHPESGRVYNYSFNPPKEKGKDDITGEPLIQRSDDDLNIVQIRLEKFLQETTPLINYYKSQNLLNEFSGTNSKELYPDIRNLVKKFIIN